eukprot:11957980-Alexandrium_andersonii.AAC.1
MLGAREHLGHRRCRPCLLDSKLFWTRAVRGTAWPRRATPRPAHTRPLRHARRWVHSSRGPRTRSPAPDWQ